MTIEVILLMALSFFITLAAFFGNGGPRTTFKNSGPRLGARIERNVTTGAGFMAASGDANWQQPSSAPPTGEIQ